MEYDKILTRIYEHIEDDQIENAVMGCLRVARHARDYLNAAVFMRELNPDRQEVMRMIHDDTHNLNEEARKFVWETSLNRWLDTHTLDFALFGSENAEDGDKHNILKIGVGEINAELEQCEQVIADMKLPSGMDPFDIAAFTDRNANHKAGIRLRMKALLTIKARVKTRCLNYAVQIERQLLSQRHSEAFLGTVQNEVNNYFKVRSEEVYSKLQKAAQLSASTDSEDAALLLTEVRRALKAAADYFYPPAPNKVICSDGTERILGEEQYLNRIQEFLRTRLDRSTARELLQAELDHLIAYIRRLNDVASKGVHASVKLAEAKQGLVGLYFLLFNICQHLTLSGDTGN